MTDRKIGPYHQDEIYLAESLEAMARIPDKVVDVVVTDPPYGIGECGKKNHSRDRMARARVDETQRQAQIQIPRWT